MNFWSEYGSEILLKLWEHLLFVLFGNFLGYSCCRSFRSSTNSLKKGSETVIKCGVFQTIPSLALLSIMIPFLELANSSSDRFVFVFPLADPAKYLYVGYKIC